MQTEIETDVSLRDDLMALQKTTILEIFKKLNSDGTVGFDHERMRKAECIDRLIGSFEPDDILVMMAKTTDRPPTAKPASMNDAGAQLALLIGQLGSHSIDEKQIRQIVDEAVKRAVVGATNFVTIKVADMPQIEMGLQHRCFAMLLKAAAARKADGSRINIWICGPAGTGKTTAARMVAKALGLTFTFNGAIATAFELSGFMDANGKCVRTPFREAWEKGGLYLFDEVDSSNPNAVLAFNAALANGVYTFPDGMVERHDDCLVLAGANTTGNGASTEYVGRMKQDSAFLDRFIQIDWPIDEKLEMSLAVDKTWCRRVQTVRAALKSRGIKGHMVTPRATFHGEALLAQGIEQSDVEIMVLKKGLAEDSWNQIK